MLIENTEVFNNEISEELSSGCQLELKKISDYRKMLLRDYKMVIYKYFNRKYKHT